VLVSENWREVFFSVASNESVTGSRKNGVSKTLVIFFLAAVNGSSSFSFNA